jgi:hypothetical protein
MSYKDVEEKAEKDCQLKAAFSGLFIQSNINRGVLDE